MDIPLLFSGSKNCSLLIVNSEILGWARPNARYLFQLWRDLPSHIIYFRNKLKSSFLTDFDSRPIEKPDNTSIKYDFLALGGIPEGLSLYFTAGINTEKEIGYFKNIHYKLYNPEINNLETHQIHSDPIELEFEEFAMILTNLGSSVGKGNIIDTETKNTLIGKGDDARRQFNELYYKTYFDYISNRIIEEGVEFVQEFLRLSGGHILALMMDNNDEVKQVIQDSFGEIIKIPKYLLHPFFAELDPEIRDKLEFDENIIEVEMKNYQQSGNSNMLSY